MNGLVNHHAGQAAEAIVAEHYQRGGCAIAARRWRGSGGEIDIILRDGEGLIFVEVKHSRSFARAVERVTPRQIERIFASAAEFAGGEPAGQLTEMRFDVALVDGTGHLRIVENIQMH